MYIYFYTFINRKDSESTRDTIMTKITEMVISEENGATQQEVLGTQGKEH